MLVPVLVLGLLKPNLKQQDEIAMGSHATESEVVVRMVQDLLLVVLQAGSYAAVV